MRGWGNSTSLFLSKGEARSKDRSNINKIMKTYKLKQNWKFSFDGVNIVDYPKGHVWDNQDEAFEAAKRLNLLVEDKPKTTRPKKQTKVIRSNQEK